MNITKTSEEWNKEYKIDIMDPDGWDRKNWDFSWNKEPITLDEFKKRVAHSTIMMNRDTLKKLIKNYDNTETE